MMMMKERKARACQIPGRFNLHIMMAKTKEEEFFFRAGWIGKKSPELDSFFFFRDLSARSAPKKNSKKKIPFFDLKRNNFFFVLFY